MEHKVKVTEPRLKWLANQVSGLLLANELYSYSAAYHIAVKQYEEAKAGEYYFYVKPYFIRKT